MRASASLRRGALSALIPLVAVGAPAAGATAEEGVPLKGRVVTPEGSPVPGVRVEILPAPLMLDPPDLLTLELVPGVVSGSRA